MSAPLLSHMQGRLTQLSIPQVGLSCSDGLPASLAGLEALNTLDLAFNDLNSTMEKVAQVSTFKVPPNEGWLCEEEGGIPSCL